MSTTAIPVHIALVDETGHVHPAALAQLAGALSEQITDEFRKDWHVAASVGAYPKDAIPQGCWAVRIRSRLDEPGALGYHTDEHNQPVSYVELTDTYSVTVGHEALEMLADPWGNRVHHAAPPAGIDPSQLGVRAHERVAYLVEVCDPCEDTSYSVGGVELSDYLLPRYYRTNPGSFQTFSRQGALTAPREVADGGYVSFGRADGEWFQVFNQGGSLSLQDIGRFNRAEHGALRVWTDLKAREFRAG